MDSWDLSIIEAITLLGGEARLSDIYSRLAANQPEALASTHNGLSSYQTKVRSHIANLCQNGRLLKAGRGSYAVTFQGKEWFLNELAAIDPKSPILARERKRKRFVLPVEVEALDEGGYLAVCPSIQGCHAEGNTVAEALDNLEDAACVLLELQHEQGWPLPKGLEKYSPERVLKAQLVVPFPG